MKVAGEINWMSQFEFQVLWCVPGRAVCPWISSECLSRSTQDCWEWSELGICDNQDKTEQRTRQHFHTICSWLCEGIRGFCLECQTVHCQLALFPLQNLGDWVSTNTNQHHPNNNECQFFPSILAQVTSWKKQGRANIFLHRNKGNQTHLAGIRQQHLYEAQNKSLCALAHVPGTDTAGAGLSLSPGVEEAKVQQEGFPALVPMSLRLPKMQFVHGQRQLLAAPSWEQGDISDVHR